MKKFNKFLSIFQLVGFTLIFLYIVVTGLKEGRMMVLYIPMAAVLFLPFFIVSGFGLLDREKHEHKINIAILVGLIFLIIPSLALPYFYELGGLIIALLCVGIGILIFRFIKDVEKKLLIFNLLGVLLLTAIMIFSRV
ncbi:MAG: hypothetical protein AB8F95_08220 [Bacteroidia bacterium]